MTTAQQAITSRASRISVSRLVTAVALAGGIGIGLVAGRGFGDAQPASLGSPAVGAAQPAAEVAGLAAYRTTQLSLRAALARNDAVAAAHFRAQLEGLATPAIVSALAHARVDLQLGLASATAWRDARMAAEFRSRLAAQDR
jgi:hypothetical protein